jgi:WhiB family transcriptional regulator, redox-sensing transcriptional regulator
MATNTWEYGWQWRAACRGEESGLFFAPNYPESKDEREARERQAKAICAVCPVRMECLEYAVRIREPHGIWGGLNELERRRLIRDMDQRRAGLYPVR